MYQLTKEVQNKVKAINGKRRTRTLSDSDIAIFYAKLNEMAGDEKVHTVCVYSSDGFVANSYRYPAPISVIEANRNETGDFNISVFTVDAKRSHGIGALVTVNGRSA